MDRFRNFFIRSRRTDDEGGIKSGERKGSFDSERGSVKLGKTYRFNDSRLIREYGRARNFWPDTIHRSVAKFFAFFGRYSLEIHRQCTVRESLPK